MLMLSVAEWFRRGLSRLPLVSRGRRRSKVIRNSRVGALVETLETRALLSSTLGVRPLVSNVSPLGTVGGGDVTVGTITFTEDSGNITVSYQIDPTFRTSRFQFLRISIRVAACWRIRRRRSVAGGLAGGWCGRGI